jgi:putative hydrolase of the HAD superfamily
VTLSTHHNRFKELSQPLDRIDTGTMPKLQRLEGIQVIAYDFYGTLFISGVGDIGVDDGDPDEEILLDVLTTTGIEIQNNDAASEGFKVYNRAVEKMISDLKSRGIEYPEPDIRLVWKEVLDTMEGSNLITKPDGEDLFDTIAIEFEARMNPVWPMPNVTETLHYFKKQGYTQGIISNSQFYTPIVLEALTGQSLEKLGFSKELLHWSYEEEMKKPGILFYENYLKKLRRFDENLNPGNVLYIGNDMLKDIYPAKTVGMKTALFAGDERSLKWRKEDSRCNRILPDLIITDFSQLPDCI